MANVRGGAFYLHGEEEFGKEAAVRELKKLVHENYGEVTINIDPDSIYTGALGGAEFARRAAEGRVEGVEA